MFNRILILTVLVILVLTGCATIKGDWEKAKGLNTITAYQEFLQNHPQSEFSDDAKHRIEKLEWIKAYKLNTVDGYQRFIKEYSSSKFISEAKQRIEALEPIAWKEAMSQNTVSEYQEFVSVYPNSQYAKEAIKRIEQIIQRKWNDTLYKNTVEAYRTFLAQHPNNRFTKLALERIKIKELKHHDWRVRAKAAVALAKIGKPAVEPLIVALKDEDWRVRVNVAWALGEMKDTGAVEPLITALKDKSGNVQESAAEALGKIGDSRAIEPLITALRDAEEYAKKSNRILAKMTKDRGTISMPLIAVPRGEMNKVFEDFPLDTPGDMIAQALGEIGGVKAVEPLIAALKSKYHNFDTLSGVARALGNIGDIRAIEPLEEIYRHNKCSRTGYSYGAYNPLCKAAHEALTKLR